MKKPVIVSVAIVVCLIVATLAVGILSEYNIQKKASADGYLHSGKFEQIMSDYYYGLKLKSTFIRMLKFDAYYCLANFTVIIAAYIFTRIKKRNDKQRKHCDK